MSFVHPLENYEPIKLDRYKLCENIYGSKLAKAIVKLDSQYDWFVLGEDGYIELYLDNHMLQNFRACEAYFVEAFLKKRGSNQPVWYLSLGTAVHKMMEIYYLHRKHPSFTLEYWIVVCGKRIWDRLNMDQFSEMKQYKDLGGLLGFGGLLIQYATYFNHDNERFRVVGTELYFGRNKEVPLHSTENYVHNHGLHPFRLYSAGKIDLLIDDGESICPIDHKTFKSFYGQNPQLSYELNEGLTGYVFASRKIVQRFNELSEEQKINRRPANKIWMNYLQIASVSKDKTLADRFKRMPLYKTDQQLEDYRLRQLRTGENILSLLLTNYPSITPSYNTQMCSNWMHNDCPFKQVHRLDSNSHDLILNSSFVSKEWKPEEPTDQDKQIGDLDEIFKN